MQGGKGYVLKTVSYGQAPPQDPTTYLLYTIFGRKSTPPPLPFRTSSTDKSFPHHIPSLELCIPKCAVFEM